VSVLHHRPVELKFASGAEPGVVEGYGAVFGNEDSWGDVIATGAFTASIAAHKAARTMPSMLWSHRPDEPIGRWGAMQEDAKGLLIKGRVNLNTTRGRDAYELLKAGDVTGLSIGFRVPEGGWTYQNSVRHLKAIDVLEVSLVSIPANGLARITGVKTADQVKSVRDFERALADELGFSRRAAAKLAAGGWPALNASDPNPDMAALALELRSAALSIRKGH
jgi:uncharacterized protein